MGRDLVEGFITEEYKAPAKKILGEALAGSEAANFEFPLYTKEGSRTYSAVRSLSAQGQTSPYYKIALTIL